jgi:hypothetical protein
MRSCASSASSCATAAMIVRSIRPIALDVSMFSTFVRIATSCAWQSSTNRSSSIVLRPSRDRE